MARIAALLHLSSFPATESISKDTMMAATGIAEFLSVHAEAAYQVMGADRSIEDAQYILSRLTYAGEEKVSRADLTRLCRGKFKKAADMRPALEVLESYYYIREVENDIGLTTASKLNIS